MPGKEKPLMITVTKAGKKQLDKHFKDRADIVLRIYMTFG